MSGWALGWAKRQEAPCRSSKSLLIALADYADENHFAWPSITTMAAEGQCSERTVQRLLRALEKAGLLVGLEVVDRATGRTRTRAYWYAIEGKYPTPNQVASFEQKTGGRVTSVSPWEGDISVTLEGDTSVRGRVTPVSPNPSLNPESSDELSQSACERDAIFAEIEAHYPAAGIGVSNRKQARAALDALATEGVELAQLPVAAGRYAADPMLKRRDYGPVSLQRWLSEGRYRGWLAVEPAAAEAEPEPAGPSWAGPPELRTAFALHFGEGKAVSYLDRAAWREADRTMAPASGVAFDFFNRDAQWLLREHDVRLAARGAAGQVQA